MEKKRTRERKKGSWIQGILDKSIYTDTNAKQMRISSNSTREKTDKRHNYIFLIRRARERSSICKIEDVQFFISVQLAG